MNTKLIAQNGTPHVLHAYVHNYIRTLWNSGLCEERILVYICECTHARTTHAHVFVPKKSPVRHLRTRIWACVARLVLSGWLSSSHCESHVKGSSGSFVHICTKHHPSITIRQYCPRLKTELIVDVYVSTPRAYLFGDDWNVYWPYNQSAHQKYQVFLTSVSARESTGTILTSRYSRTCSQMSAVMCDKEA